MHHSSFSKHSSLQRPKSAVVETRDVGTLTASLTVSDKEGTGEKKLKGDFDNCMMEVFTFCRRWN